MDTQTNTAGRTTSPSVVGSRAPTPPPGPLSFAGRWSFITALALLPAAKITTETIVGAGFPILVGILLVGLSFPALLLPSLPPRSRGAVMSARLRWRCLVALPPFLLGMIMGQLAVFESLGTWDGVHSFARLAFAVAAFVAAALIVFWDNAGR